MTTGDREKFQLVQQFESVQKRRRDQMTNQPDEQMTSTQIDYYAKVYPNVPHQIFELAREGLKLREDTKFKVDMATAVSVEGELRKHIFTLNAKLASCRDALKVQIETAKVYAVEINSIRADKERLDWLENQAAIHGEEILGITITWADTLRHEIDSARKDKA